MSHVSTNTMKNKETRLALFVLLSVRRGGIDPEVHIICLTLYN